MVGRVLSKECKSGKCESCGDYVYQMAFIKKESKGYGYTCFDCAGVGISSRKKPEWVIEVIDAARLAREEILTELLKIAEADMIIFDDPRLNVIKSFVEEVVEGEITERLENYIRFNGNDMKDVLKLRDYAISAKNRDGSKYEEVVKLYITSRIKKLEEKEINEIRLLLTDRDVQSLHPEYKLVWDHIEELKEEILRGVSSKRYDNIEDLKELVRFVERYEYLTEPQLNRLKSFYFEMVRRNKRKNS